MVKRLTVEGNKNYSGPIRALTKWETGVEIDLSTTLASSKSRATQTVEHVRTRSGSAGPREVEGVELSEVGYTSGYTTGYSTGYTSGYTSGTDSDRTTRASGGGADLGGVSTTGWDLGSRSDGGGRA